MTILRIIKRPMDHDTYQALNTSVNLDRDHPLGLIMHGASDVHGMTQVAQVWDSAEYARRFDEECLKPALQALGAPESRCRPVRVGAPRHALTRPPVRREVARRTLERRRQLGTRGTVVWLDRSRGPRPVGHADAVVAVLITTCTSARPGFARSCEARTHPPGAVRPTSGRGRSSFAAAAVRSPSPRGWRCAVPS